MDSTLYKSPKEILYEEINFHITLKPDEEFRILRAMNRFKNQEKDRLRTKLKEIIINKRTHE